MADSTLVHSNATEFLSECVLCGSSAGESFQPYAKKSGYAIVQCKKCKLIFVNPRDPQDTVIKQYVNNETSPISYYLNTVPVDMINFNKRLHWIENKVPKGRLLDIGCSVGTFMTAAKQRGWDVEGIEANEEASAICKQKELKVYNGLFEPELIQAIPKKDFDLVCLNDSIEHFSNPYETLKLAWQLVRKNGFLAVNTPNIDDLLARIFQIKPKEHLFYFNRESLSEILVKSGFEVERMVETGQRRDIGSMHLGATFENKNWLLLSKFLAITKLDSIISIFLDRCFSDELFVLAKKS